MIKKIKNTTDNRSGKNKFDAIFMKKFYYFSESKLNFVEIKNFNRKFLIVVSVSVLILTSILFGGYLVVDNYFNPDHKIANLKTENRKLSAKLTDIVDLYKKLSKEVDSLTNVNDHLRIAANLEPISEDVRQLGIGGASFDDSFLYAASESKIDLNVITNYVDKVKNQVEFEKQNYFEISNKLQSNELLFQSIPALKPTTGHLTAHGFGMRMHPIFKVRRMHHGIDIVTNIGTPVHAPGDGTVVFVGRRGGYGIAIEIDHGFGYRTIYGHLSKVKVKYKQKIKRGDVIALTGNTGISTGPHLHYEVHHNGVKLDPEGFFFEDFQIFDLTAQK